MPESKRLPAPIPEDLHPDLDFIRSYVTAPNNYRYTDTPFLEDSDFGSEIWNVKAAHVYTIDWRTTVGTTGGLLTSRSHEALWRTFRSWLCVQAHPDRAGPVVNAKSLYNRMRHVGALIDYFLLNADRLGIAEHGFGAISDNDVIALVGLLEAGPIGINLYDWPGRVSKYLRSQIAKSHEAVLRGLIKDTPALSLPIPDERLTDLSDEEIVLSRAVLWHENMYIRTTRSNRLSVLKPDATALQARVFPLRFTHPKSMPMAAELLLMSRPPRRREFPAVPVRNTEHSHRSTASVMCYLDAINSLALLRRDSLEVPNVSSLRRYAFSNSPLPGRFATLPSETVFMALRKAITYVLERGDHLVASYLSVCEGAQRRGCTIRELDKSEGILQFFPDEAIALGLRRWSADVESFGQPRLTEYQESSHSLLREGVGLFDALRVLFGACQIILGALGARRDGEMQALRSGSALDHIGSSLVFLNRKSGVGEFRERIRIPIPPIAVTCVRLLEHLHEGMLSKGLIAEAPSLFAFPKKNGPPGLVTTQTTNSDESFDYFCDWAELPLDDYGRRPYIRQHQLRRFFAMLFFWGHGLNQIDTLREFLGHNNAKHVYHYITESTPGSVLLGIKASYVAGLMANERDHSKLGALLLDRFGISDFHLVSSEDMAPYISALIAEGTVSVEPVFIDHDKRYKILVKVQEVGADAAV